MKKNHSNTKIFDPKNGYLLIYKNDGTNKKIQLKIGGLTKDLLDLTDLQGCGNDNPNLCLFAFNFNGFFNNKDGFSGTYLRYVDIYHYGDLSDVVMTRLYLDRTESNDNSDDGILSKFWRKYSEWFSGYDGGYGARISNNFNGIISIGKNYDKNGYNYCLLDSGYFHNLSDGYYNCKSYSSEFGSNKVRMLTSIGGPSANILNYTDVVIRDFLAGNKGFLKRTIKDVVGNFEIKSKISGKNNASSNSENWKDGTFSKPKDFFSDVEFEECDGANILCHIKNFFRGFFGFFISLIKSFVNPIIDFLKTIWTFFEVFLNYFLSFFNNGEGLFGEGEKIVCNSNYNFSDGEKKFLSTIFKNNSLNIYSSNPETDSFISQYATIFDKTLSNIVAFFRAVNPVPPSNGDDICTYMGLKKLHIGDTTFIDVIISFLFFVGIFFIFYKS